jgi:hypothetical protein
MIKSLRALIRIIMISSWAHHHPSFNYDRGLSPIWPSWRGKCIYTEDFNTSQFNKLVGVEAFNAARVPSPSSEVYDVDVHHPLSLLRQFIGKTGKLYPDSLWDETSRRMLLCVLIPSSSAHWFWGTKWQTSSHLVLRSKPRNRRGDFEA